MKSYRAAVAPGFTVELLPQDEYASFRPDAVGTVAYSLFDRFNRCIGCGEVKGTKEAAFTDAQALHRALARCAGEVRP